MKTTKLYNVMFPIWFLFVFPITWLFIIPVNFLIDSAVIWATIKRFKVESPFAFWKSKILFVWMFGFLADLIGALLIIGLYSLLVEIYPDLGSSLIRFPGTCLIAIPGVALSGALIYFLNKKVSFKKTLLDKTQVHKLCLVLSCITAPYTMLIPLYW